MPKRREPKAANISRIQPSVEQVEAFAAAADGHAVAIPQEENTKPLNPNAVRDYKAIRVPFNEYEYMKLVEGSAATGRTKLNFIRHAMLKMAEQEASE